MRKVIVLKLSLLLCFVAYASELTERSRYKLEYSIFKIDVQNMFLYSVKKYKTLEDFITTRDERALRVQYLRSLKKDDLNLAWEKSLAPILKEQLTKKYKDSYDLLRKFTPSVEKDDEIYLLFKNDKMQFYFNKKFKGEIHDREFNQSVLRIWLGDLSVSQELSTALSKGVLR